MTSPFVSYAQNLEDVFIDRCFRERQSGFYIDVGASHPVTDSPTYASYCRGWHGLNVEPIPERARELRRLRPRDITIEAACGAEIGEILLYRTDGMGGLSSCLPHSVSSLRTAGIGIDEFSVPLFTLDALCERHGISNAQFLKIDVEGYEDQVLTGFSLDICRPELLIIEVVSTVNGADDAAWAARLERSDYIQAYDDAVNRYFVRGESRELLANFEKPISVLDNFEQFHASGYCLARSDHADYGWGLNFARSLLRHVAHLSAEQTASILASDIAEAALSAPLDLDGINRGYRLVFGRWATVEDAVPMLARAEREAMTLGSLLIELLGSEEFLRHLGRAAASA